MLAYRFLTEDDTAAFCHKVTKALSEDWILYGNPTYGFDPQKNIMRCGQAVTKEVDATYHDGIKLKEL